MLQLIQLLQLLQVQPQSQPLQLHYTALQLPLPLQLQPTKSTFELQLQLHCAASKCLSVHRFIRSAIHHSQEPPSPICFLSLQLPLPPCAVHTGILVYQVHCLNYPSVHPTIHLAEYG